MQLQPSQMQPIGAKFGSKTMHCRVQAQTTKDTKRALGHEENKDRGLTMASTLEGRAIRYLNPPTSPSLFLRGSSCSF